MLRVSSNRYFFMVRSRGVSVQKEGLWLTSSRRGVKSSVSKMSKPSTSKQTESWSAFNSRKDLYLFVS